MNAGHSAEQHSRYLLQPTDTLQRNSNLFIRFVYGRHLCIITPVPEQTNSCPVITGNNIRLGNAWGAWGVGGYQCLCNL